MRRILLSLIFLLGSSYVFADYNQDLELRRLLDDLPGFIEYKDETIADKYLTAREYISLIKAGVLYVEHSEVVINAQEYFDEYCEKIIEYDNSSKEKLTFHDFFEWTSNYIRTNRGKFPKPTK